MPKNRDSTSLVVRSFQLTQRDAARVARLAHEADRSWSAEVRRAVSDHLARAERTKASA
jgi:predicted transcriptional regulator